MTTFSELGVEPDIAGALEAVGITTPFPIQALTLQLALAGNDIIGQAKTGTGKTLGFGIPVLQRIPTGQPAAPSVPDALVIVPTRELCVQVADDLAQAGGPRGIRVLAAYGGRAYEPQAKELQKGIHVVVGTPGRLLDLVRQKELDLSKIRSLVLDEADQMLDMGFLPDVERLLALTPKERQTMLFSATLPGPIVTMGRRHLTKPTQIRAESGHTGATVEGVEQHVLRVHNLDKDEVLARILQAQDRGLSIIFTATKRSAKKVTEELQKRGFSVAAVHGDLDQGAREQGLRAFRTGKVDVLVATDVAARGLDVDAVTHVVNYSCPKDPQTYLHRIGRTARAGATGIAVTFVDWDALHLWAGINKEHMLGFEEPLETYSTSPHLYERLRIPEGVGGSLPKAARTRAGLDAEKREELGPPPRSAGAHSGDTGGSRSGADRPAGRSRAEGEGRRRSRGRGGAADAGDAAPDSRTPEAAPKRRSSAEGATEPGADETKPRRRRTRGGRGSSESGTDNPAGDAAASGDKADRGARSRDTDDDGGSGNRPRRNRRRTRSGQPAGDAPVSAS